MTEYKNPLALNDDYCDARRKQSGRKVDEALELWRRLLQRYEYGSAEYVEVLRQIAVCLRLTADLNASADRFHEAYQLAKQIHPILVARTMRDWSALWLEQGDNGEATRRLQEVLESLPENSDEWLATLGYHGRTIARLDSLNDGHHELRTARKGLRGKREWKALRYDFLLWMIELRPVWHIRSLYSLWRVVYAVQALPGGIKRGLNGVADLVVTFVGGYKLRDEIRRRWFS